MPVKRRVEAILKQLEALKQTLSVTNIEQFDETELTIRLEYIEQVNKSFNDAQSKFEEESNAEIDVDEIMNFTNLYFEVKAAVSS